MKVQLAYEYEGHEPDEVVEVPDATGRRLIAEGRARVPDESKPKPSETTSKTTSKTTKQGE